MKKLNYIILITAAVMAFSCTREAELQETQTQTQTQTGELVTIRVSTPEAIETKVSLTEAGDKKAMNLAWENTDQLSVNGGLFSVTNVISDHEAEFEGPTPEGSTFTVIYPGSYASADAFNARSYAAQTQSGNSSTAHLEYNAMLSGVTAYAEPKFDPTWATDNGGSLVQNGAIQLRLQLPEGTSTATSVKLVASRAVFPTTNAGGETATTQTLSLSSITLPSNRILEAYMMFSAAGVAWQAGDKLTVTVDTPEGMCYRTLPEMTAQTWTGGSQYTIQCKVNANNFVINNADDLEDFRDGVNSGDFLWQSCSVSLGADIDCSGIASWTPIGNGTFEPVESGTVSATMNGPAFKGIFNGNNHAINNLVMTASPDTYAPYGLFGILYKATVKNLTLGAVSADTGALTATPVGRMDAGALAGVAYGSTIQDVTNYFPMTIPDNTSANRVAMGMVGYVYGDDESGKSVLSGLKNYGAVNATQSGSNTGNGATSVQVAGIAGFGNSGGASIINQISGCTNYANIETSTGRSAGVLATANTRTEINGCFNRGKINNSYTNARVGGITVIIAGSCTITDCINYGNVSATESGSNVGGIVCLVNHASAVVSGSGNEGVVEGFKYVGGIASRIYAGEITTCVNTGDVTGDSYIGGIVGGLGNNSAFPHVEKCRSNASVSASLNGSSRVGGIVGEMLSGILNTCSAKGSVTSAGYDIGGIVGIMYCSTAGSTYGRQYVYDCLAANNVTSTRAGTGGARLGGVIGYIWRYYNKDGETNPTDQYLAVDNCIGLNQTLSAGTCTNVGAFAGMITAGVATNYNRVRVRNNITLVEDGKFNATGASNVGGFVGSMPFGYMAHDYYVVSDHSQSFGGTGKTTTDNVTKSTSSTLTSAAFCTEHSTRATTYFLNVGDPAVKYASSGWEIPAGVSYPVPSTLAALGEDYYK